MNLVSKCESIARCVSYLHFSLFVTHSGAALYFCTSWGPGTALGHGLDVLEFGLDEQRFLKAFYFLTNDVYTITYRHTENRIENEFGKNPRIPKFRFLASFVCLWRALASKPIGAIRTNRVLFVKILPMHRHYFELILMNLYLGPKTSVLMVYKKQIRFCKNSCQHCRLEVLFDLVYNTIPINVSFM